MTEHTEQCKCNCPSFSPNYKLELPRRHSRTALDRLESNKDTKLPPLPEVVWQQPAETNVNPTS